MGNLKNMFKNKLFTVPLAISSMIFLLSFLAGVYLYDVLLPVIGNEISMDNIEVGTLDILKNNMTVFYVNIGLSIITLGLYGIFANAFNGLTLGIVMGIAHAKFGLKTTLLRIIPHGVLEIPVLIVSTAFGFIVIGLLINLINRRKIDFKRLLKQNVLLIIIMTLFVVVAAVVEGQISMNLR
ncbi:stage II sporulation protein M [Sutcliffiella horikoshii]|uniref:stage II sporulation protein M n=1 Tax=Sutcliffiella horikoshii TaxID=79883 RepID=UPI00384C24E1